MCSSDLGADEQLAELEKYLASVNLLAEYALSMRGERACSTRGLDWLRRQGFQTVYDLSGGLFAWANQGRPMEAEGRAAADVHPYSTVWGRLLKPAVRADRPPITDPLSLP